LPIVTGALGVQLFHLNLVWGIVAISSVTWSAAC
jgi:NCS1 family nucleobase:cation symporter-1